MHDLGVRRRNTDRLKRPEINEWGHSSPIRYGKETHRFLHMKVLETAFV
jgi:hypothetical protein